MNTPRFRAPHEAPGGSPGVIIPATPASNPPRVHPSAPRGFTLVELLVVIGIIALLAGLLTPAVMQAMSTARDAAIKSEVEMLHMAFVKYKSEYGEFPPSDMTDTAAVRRHLQKLFPRIDSGELNAAISTWSGGGNLNNSLSPAQCLVLWLQGYYDNPQFPLTNNGLGGSRNKLFEFETSRLYGVSNKALVDDGNGYKGWSEAIIPRANSASIYPVYVGPNCKGVPYAYFASPFIARYPAGSSNTRIPAYRVTATVGGGEPSSIAPYLSSIPPLENASFEFCSNGKFQIIAPGRDGSFGGPITAGAVSVPQLAGVAGSTSPLPGLTLGARQQLLQTAGFPFSLDLPTGHLDNISNFAAGPLKQASEKALK